MDESLQAFVLTHENDDPAWLVLHRDRWPEVDVALAAECIAARRKLRNKVPEWYADPGIVCPLALSAEQCSSTATARYKAAVAMRAMPSPYSHPQKAKGRAETRKGPSIPALLFRKPEALPGIAGRIADLTGGLGVDCWQFSKIADRVLYNEMNPLLAKAAEENLARLGCSNVGFSSIRIDAGTLPPLLDSFRPDIVFIDPARRGEGGRKIFLPEDCSPDVLTLQDIILKRGIRLMVKLSPMADISLMLSRFHNVKEIHAVQADGECRELLLLQEPGFDGEATTVVAVEGGEIRFLQSEEKAAMPSFISAIPSPGMFLFEPGAALSKSGAFNLTCARYGLQKLGPSAHLYVADAIVSSLSAFGKWFEIQEVAPFGKASVKDFSSRWPDAECTARALPLSSEELRKKMALRGGGHIHIFAAGTSVGRLIISTKV
jgi:hypothetical protein